MAPTVWHVIVPGRLLGGCSRHYQSWHFQIGVGAESKDRDKRSYGRRRHRGTGGSSLNVTRSLRRGS